MPGYQGADAVKLAFKATKVDDCPRCHKAHSSLEFWELTFPSDLWTHWAICPETGEPVMMKIKASVPG